MNVKYTIALLILSFTLILSSCGNRRDESRQQEPVAVRVQRVVMSDGIADRTFVGTVKAGKSVLVSCQYPGKVMELNVSQGENVQEGHPVAQIDSYTVRSSYDMAKATLRQAEDGYGRLMKVKTSNSVPEVKIIEVETQLSQARASYDAARNALENCTVKAPFNGVIGEIFVEQGVEINPLEPILRLYDTSVLEVSISVPENEIGKINVGDIGVVTIPALDNKSVHAKVISKGIDASPLSHCYDMVLQLSGDTENVMPGMVGRVSIPNGVLQRCVIPASVIKMDNKGKYVWIVVDSKVEKRYVDITGFVDKGIAINAGLNSGDFIITDGSQKVSSGMIVNVVE